MIRFDKTQLYCDCALFGQPCVYSDFATSFTKKRRRGEGEPSAFIHCDLCVFVLASCIPSISTTNCCFTSVPYLELKLLHSFSNHKLCRAYIYIYIYEINTLYYEWNVQSFSLAVGCYRLDFRTRIFSATQTCFKFYCATR